MYYQNKGETNPWLYNWGPSDHFIQGSQKEQPSDHSIQGHYKKETSEYFIQGCQKEQPSDNFIQGHKNEQPSDHSIQGCQKKKPAKLDKTITLKIRLTSCMVRDLNHTDKTNM